MAAEDALAAVLTLRRGGLARVGLERVALIEAVDRLGSISAAARELGLSYKGAWDAVQALNNLFDGPLIAAAPGGRAGGTAEVTARGRAVAAAFRQVEREMGRAVARLERLTGDDLDLTQMIWSLGMRTSARNALRGVVASISEGAVNSEVILSIGEGVQIVAVVTRRSIADLDLAPGSPAIALIKSSFIVLAKGEGLLTSARNQLPGQVVAREDGRVSSEIVLDIGAGKTLAAVITRESAERMALATGDAVTALIKAPHVILAVE